MQGFSQAHIKNFTNWTRFKADFKIISEWLFQDLKHQETFPRFFSELVFSPFSQNKIHLLKRITLLTEASKNVIAHFTTG